MRWVFLTFTLVACAVEDRTAHSSRDHGDSAPRIVVKASFPGPVQGDSENGMFIGTPNGPVRLDDFHQEDW